jgi:Gametolysin peptidase M11
MMFQLCLWSLISLSLAHPSQLRGSVIPSSIFKQLKPEDKPTVLCRVATFGTMLVDDVHGTSYTEENTFCLPIVDKVELDVEFPITLPDEIRVKHEVEIEMGTLLVSVSEAMIFEQQLVLGFETQYTVIPDSTIHRHLLNRHLQVKPVMTIAVVRVSTTDSSPTASRNDLQSTLFSPSGVNFVNQYKAVSFGKLQFELAPAGVLEVQVSSPVSSFASSSDLVTAAQEQIKSTYQITDVSTLADKVLMCLPPGTGNWAASAGVNHWRAQFNNDWCTSLSGTMHELGHTMGLLHARDNGVEYADRTGYMGSGYPSSTFPKKAFNGYNSWKFGWYSDRHFTIHPDLEGGKIVKIASFVDYNLASTDEYAVVSVSDQFFLQFNEQKGFNIETEQKQNQVTVTESTTTGTDSRAGLDVGLPAFTVANFNGSGQTMSIEACRRSLGRNGASVMEVSISMGQSLCAAAIPTASPVTVSPTASPVTASPTAAPVTASPTAAPVTASPTASPVTTSPTASLDTASPTAAPVTLVPVVAAPVVAAPVAAAPVSLPPASTTPSVVVGVVVAAATPAPAPVAQTRSAFLLWLQRVLEILRIKGEGSGSA